MRITLTPGPLGTRAPGESEDAGRGRADPSYESQFGLLDPLRIRQGSEGNWTDAKYPSGVVRFRPWAAMSHRT